MSLFDHCQDIEVLLQGEEAAAFLCSLKPNKITSPNPQMNEMTFTTNTPKRQRRWCIDIGFPILNVGTILRVIENVQRPSLLFTIFMGAVVAEHLGAKVLAPPTAVINFTPIRLAILLPSSVWCTIALCLLWRYALVFSNEIFLPVWKIHSWFS